MTADWVTLLLIGIAALVGIMLPRWTIDLPRALVASSHLDARYLRRQPRMARRPSIRLQRTLWALWLLLASLIALSEAPVPWKAYTLVVAAMLLLGGAIDYHTGLLPFRISMVLGFAGLTHQSAVAPETVTTHLWVSAALFAVLYGVNRIGQRVSLGELLGGGDIALLCAISLGMPWDTVAWAVWLASLSGWIETKLRHTPRVRFGPHLAVAILSVWIYPVLMNP